MKRKSQEIKDPTGVYKVDYSPPTPRGGRGIIISGEKGREWKKGREEGKMEGK